MLCYVIVFVGVDDRRKEKEGIEDRSKAKEGQASAPASTIYDY